MDSRLFDSLTAWEKQIDVLAGVREKYFLLESRLKSTRGIVLLAQDAKNAQEREAKTDADPFYVSFVKELTMSKIAYMNSTDKLELFKKRYEAEYLSLKLESECIKKYQ